MVDASKDILQELEQWVPALTPFRSLIIIVSACLGAGFWFGHTIIGDGERAALKEQVELYKAKLQVGSPDEALKKLQALEAKIDALEPKQQRRLSAEQQADLASALAPIAKEITPALYVFFEGTPEEDRYLGDFITVFKRANITGVGPILGYSNTEKERGVLVGLKNPEHPSDLAIKFIDALRKAGVEPSTTHWPNAANFPGPDFDLFVAAQ